MLNQFSKYFSIGILNTLIHWGISYALYVLGSPQSICNLVGFTVAVIFSFFMNAKFTFRQRASRGRFLSYTLFMGVLSYIIGAISDMMALPVLFTLVVFSGISLICGFLYAKFLVFKC